MGYLPKSVHLVNQSKNKHTISPNPLALVIFGLIFSILSIVYFVHSNDLPNRLAIDSSHTTIASPTPLAQSVIKTIQIPFTDKATRKTLVYLPKGYLIGQKTPTYPVIYLLHGSPGKAEDWPGAGKAKETLDTLIGNKTIPPTIGVFPEGNGGLLNDSQYIDSIDGKSPVETFIVKNVVGYIDRQYPTRPESKWRAIGGLSSGGYGALNLGLKHQDIFGSIISLAGYGTIEQNIFNRHLIQGSKSLIDANSPDLYITNLKTTTVKVWLAIGEKDSLLADNQHLDNLLRKAGFNPELHVFGGGHEWHFWITHLTEGLQWLAKSWNE